MACTMTDAIVFAPHHFAHLHHPVAAVPFRVVYITVLVASVLTGALSALLCSNWGSRQLLTALFDEMGWEQLAQGAGGVGDTGYRLKWCEKASDIDFRAFKEGKQLVSRNPGMTCVTDKLDMVRSLLQFHASATGSRRPGWLLRLWDYIPETFELASQKGRAEFYAAVVADPAASWICKPAGLACGAGIFLVPDGPKYAAQLAVQDASRNGMVASQARVIQRYLAAPLLLHGRKFDLRSYMLVASAKPLIGLHGDAYCRLSVEEYGGADMGNLAAHLTNQSVQKKHPMYKKMQEETTWTMARLNDHINGTDSLLQAAGCRDWALDVLPAKIRAIKKHVLGAIEGNLVEKIGVFDLLGLDFMVDEAFDVWLIEVNTNPALHTNCSALKAVIPAVVKSAVGIVMDIFARQARKEPALPITCDLGGFELLETT